MRYFESLNLKGLKSSPNSDLEKALLYVFEHEGGMTIRHRPELPPQLIIEIGEKISEIGRRLQH